jgi:hypothetical protein
MLGTRKGHPYKTELATKITNSPFSRIKRTSNCFFMQEVYIVAESRESGQEKIQQSVD